MLQESPTSNLRFNNIFKDGLFIKRENYYTEFIKSDRQKVNNNFIAKSFLGTKKSGEFSSLEKIRMVVDGLIGEVTEKEICRRENISYDTFLDWKNEFLEAFKAYSEIELLQRAISSKNRELIAKEAGIEVYNFFRQFANISSSKNLVIAKGNKLSGYSDFNAIENIILLDKLNDFRQINKQLEEINRKLPADGLLMGSFETFHARAGKRKISKIPVLRNLYFAFDFIFKRVFPKLPVLKKLYFFVTKGKNRLLSKAESLGRIVSCGFDIIDFKEIEGINYFVVRKVKEPAYDMNPSYGPLFRMRRIGKNGKIIKVFKFRTMHPYSEYLHDYILKVNGYAETGKPANDFRLVPYAKFLRRYWIDELPQLINLVKGDLKLVGCRPVSERYFKDIPKDIQELRLKQKPGCIPPYVALNRSGSVECVLQAEKEYLLEKQKNPYFTDAKYVFKAIYNIVFKNKRSA